MTPAQRARVELRRRQEMQMSPILRRSAEKLARAMPEIVEEFSETTTEQLISMILDDVDDYVRTSLEPPSGTL